MNARDRDDHAARDALASLCEIYWPPVYAYVRRAGYDAEEAKDLTQEFFTLLIEKNFLKDVRPERGKFRNFLLTAVKHFLANEWDKLKAQKRGGDNALLSLDVLEVENRLGRAPGETTSPEDVYRRNWALALLDRAWQRLRGENADLKRRARFALLERYITAAGEHVPYARLHQESGIPEGALRVSVHRLRKRYGQLIREEIAHTVETEAEIAEELHDLLDALS